MVILGSGTIDSQLTAERLIDAYTIVVNPIVLGSGRKIFDGVQEKQDLTLKRTRVFDNGNLVARSGSYVAVADVDAAKLAGMRCPTPLPLRKPEILR